MIEEWRDIEGYEGKYQVSNTGRVKSLQYHRGNSERCLIPKKGKNGYLYVVLSKENKVKTFKIHRLVATYFIQNKENKPYVNHKDGNKENNNVENLEWVTPLENNLHAFYVLGKHPMRGMKYDKNKKSIKVNQYIITEEGYKYHIATYANAEIAAKINGLCMRSIQSCCRKEDGYLQCGGYYWDYQKK